MDNKQLTFRSRVIFVLLQLCALLAISYPAYAVDASSLKLKESLKLGETDLYLNGFGTRSKYFIDLYTAALYLKGKSTDAKAILSADEAMLIQIHVISNLITSETLSKGTKEGFEKATNHHTAPIQEMIDQFVTAFDEEISIGDTFEIVYQPAKGVTVVKNRTIVKRLPKDFAFKHALFGIWLSEQPAQDSLKNGLLGY